MKYVFYIIFSVFVLTSYGQTKYYIPRVKIIDSKIDSQSVSFKVVSKIPLKKMEDNGVQKSVANTTIKVSLNLSMITIGVNTTSNSYIITDKETSEAIEGSYYGLNYFEKKNKKKYLNILFPKDENESIIIIDTDKKGNGWLYYCEII